MYSTHRSSDGSDPKDELAAGGFADELEISDDGDDSDGASAAADSPYGI
jgi:hypothetical protein